MGWDSFFADLLAQEQQKQSASTSNLGIASITPFYTGKLAYDITDTAGNKYVYVPKEAAEKGFIRDGYQFINPAFLKEGAFSKAGTFTLPNADALTSAAKSIYSNPTQGYIWKAEDFAPYSNDFGFEGYGISASTPAITGLGTFQGKPVFLTAPPPGQDYGFYTGGGSFTGYTPEKTYTSGPFGGFIGEVFNPFITAGAGLISGLSSGLAGFGQGISDTIYGIGSAIAKDPLLSTAAGAALMAAGVPAPIASALIAANAGASPEQIIKAAVLAGAVKEFSPTVANAVSNAVGGGAVGAAAANALISGGIAAATGGNVLNAIAAGGVSSGVNTLLQSIPEYASAPQTAQNAIRASLTAALSGNRNPSAAFINSLVGSAGRAIGQEINDQTLINKYSQDLFPSIENAQVSLTDPDVLAKQAGWPDAATQQSYGYDINAYNSALALGAGFSTYDDYQKYGGDLQKYQTELMSQLPQDQGTAMDDTDYTDEGPTEVDVPLDPGEDATKILADYGITGEDAAKLMADYGITGPDAAKLLSHYGIAPKSPFGTFMNFLGKYPSSAGLLGLLGGAALAGQQPAPPQVPQTPVGVGLAPTYQPTLYQPYARGGVTEGGISTLGGYSDGGRLLRGPGDGVSDSIPATIGDKQPARLADAEFVIPARIVSEIGNGSTDAGARKLYQMMDRVQKRRQKSIGKDKFAVDSKAYKELDKL